MRAADIVTQLLNKLPQLTDLFTDDVPVVSVVRSGTTLTVTTSVPHKVVVNENVSLAGAETPINLTAIVRIDTVGTLTTEINHDITEPVKSNPNTRTTVVLSGSDDTFNGTFNLLTVPNRRTITFEMPDSGSLVATGAPIIENGSSALQSAAHLYPVATVVSPTVLTVEDPGNAAMLDPVGDIALRKSCRVTRAVNMDRFLEAHTEKVLGNIKGGSPIEKLWACVVLGNPIASKDRTLANDATSNIAAGDNYRQQIEYPFSVFVIIPSQNEVAAGKARDLAGDLITVLGQCLLGKRFDTQTAIELQGGVNYIGDSGFEYNTAYYVHEYQYTQVSDLIFADTTGPAVDVAFRDIDFDIFTTINIDEPASIVGTDNTVDLDDEDLT